MNNKKKNKLAVSASTIAAAVYPVIKRRAKGLGPKAKEYRKGNGAKGPQPALFLLNALRQVVHNEITHVYITDATRASLSDIADRFHAKGMICDSPNKVLSVIVNTPEFEAFAQKMAAKMIAHIEGGAARFEFDPSDVANTHEEVDGDAQEIEEG